MKDSNNDSYMKASGMSDGKVMKNHGNTKKVVGDNQKFDMARCQKRGHESKGNSKQAFEYKY